MTRETKAGLLMIVMLVGVFGVMVYKRVHQPSAALAQQDHAPTGESGSTPEEAAETNDPFLANAGLLPTAAVVPDTAVPDTVAAPARIPDDGVSNSPADNTLIPVRVKSLSSLASSVGTPAVRNVAATRPSPMPAEEFNPFESAEAEKNHATTSPAAQPVTTSGAIPIPVRATSINEPSFGPPLGVTDAKQKSPAPVELSDSNDPFANGQPRESVTFEAPVTKPTGGPGARANALRQEQAADDPFADNSLEVQRPASSVPATAQPGASSDAAFNTPQRSLPATEPASNIDNAFDQEPVKSEVPTLKIPSRDSAPRARPATSDDRLGGFRPVAQNDTPTNTFPEAQPNIPAAIGEGPRRASRPAPVTEIDEDFGSKPTARPLVAGDTYQIEPNENYWTISRKKYGTGRYFMALAQHNAQIVTDPKRMRPGVVIATPPTEALERAYAQLIPKLPTIDPVQTVSGSVTRTASAVGTSSTINNSATIKPVRATESEAEAGFFVTNDGAPMYRIGEEDTLSGIAQRHLGRSSRWVVIQ